VGDDTEDVVAGFLEEEFAPGGAVAPIGEGGDGDGDGGVGGEGVGGAEFVFGAPAKTADLGELI
jgi:hypothetical protein